MSDKNNIDKLFKDKLHSYHAAYNPEAWKKMEQMLRKKQRKITGYWILGTMLSIITLATITWKFMETPEQKAVKPQHTTETTLFSSPNEKQSNSIKQEEIQKIKTKEPTAASTLSNNNSKSDNKQTQIEKQPTTSTLAETIQNKQEKAKTQNKINTPANFTPASTAKKYYPKTTKSKKMAGMLFLPAYKIYLSEDYGKQQIKQYKAMVKAEKRQQRLPLRDRLNFLRKTSIGLIGDVSAYEGLLNTGKTRDKTSLTPGGGFRVSYIIDNMTSIDINILYAYRGNTNSVSQTNASGKLISTKNLQLHYIDIPLLINYRINRHALLIGLKYSILAQTKDETTILKYDQGNTTIEQSTVNYQLNKSFATMDLGITFGYQYLITEQLNMGIRTNYGLFDVTDNTIYQNAIDDRNISIQLTLDYTLFKY